MLQFCALWEEPNVSLLDITLQRARLRTCLLGAEANPIGSDLSITLLISPH